MYGSTQAPKSVNPAGDARHVHEALTDLGLADKMPELGKHLGVADRHRSRARTNHAAEVAATKTQLVRQVVAGKIDPDKAAEQLIEAQAQADRETVAADFHKSLASASGQAAWRVVTDADDKLVTETLAPEVDKVVSTIEKNAPLIEGIDSADDAVAAGGKALTAWGAVDEASRRYNKLQQLAEFLRLNGAVPLSRRVQREGGSYDFVCRHPEHTDEAMIGRAVQPLGLVALVASGAEPTVLTSSEVEQVWNRLDAEQAQAQPARRRASSGHGDLGAGEAVDTALERVGLDGSERWADKAVNA